MRRLGLLLGLLLIVLQNLVFWQSLLPQAGLGQQVCQQISRALHSPSEPKPHWQDQPNAVAKLTALDLHRAHQPLQQRVGLDSDVQHHHQVDRSQHLDDSSSKHVDDSGSQPSSDCHICQLFHTVLPLFKPNFRLKLARIQIRFSLASVVIDRLLAVKQLFLSPQSRAPPFFSGIA